MKKITYLSMKLKTDTATKTFKFQDNEFEVLKYLPVEDKYSLIMITLQESFEDGIYNPFKLDMYFHLNLIYMYVTNLTFTEKQKEDANKIYDTLISSGFMNEVLKTIPEVEYNLLYNYITTIVKDLTQYNSSINSVINQLVEALPKNMQKAQEIMKNFDPEEYKNVIDFAKAANGDRDVK